MKALRKRILEAASRAGEGHIPSALSILDILWVLYDQVLHTSPEDFESPERDRFILSKGHASLALYTVLAAKGFIEFSELESFASYSSRLGGHPDTRKVPGVEASTGSLGHGFPMSLGMALALKIQKIPARVFCLIGDGEANEGTIWESALLASHHQLSHLCCIVDSNHSTDRALGLGQLSRKFESFGWETQNIDGHSHFQILQALKYRSEKPRAIIAETIKGYGIKSMENNPEWHHKSPNPEQLQKFIGELA